MLTNLIEGIHDHRTIICSKKLYVWCKAVFDDRPIVMDPTMLASDFYFFNRKGQARMVDTVAGLVFMGDTKVRRFPWLRALV